METRCSELVPQLFASLKDTVNIFFRKICLSSAKLAFIESLYNFVTLKTHFDEPQVKVGGTTFRSVDFGQFFRRRNAAAAAAAMTAEELSSFIIFYLILPNRWVKYHRTRHICLLGKFVK